MSNLYRLKSRVKGHLRKPWKRLKRLPDDVRLQTARAVHKVWPSAIAGGAETLYPPDQLCASTVDWVRRQGGRAASVIEVDAAYTFSNAPPKTVHDEIRNQFLIDLEFFYPATFVASIREGRVWDDGFVITPDNHVLEDVSVDFKSIATKQSSVITDWKFQPLAMTGGNVAVLATGGGGLYYHWILQLLPRLELIRRAGIDLASIDKFAVNTIASSFQRETLALLGIDPGKVIETSNVPYLKAENLIVPSIPLGGGCFSPWMCDFLRRTFTSADPSKIKSKSRRLYITRERAGYRRILNEPEVSSLLAARGFEKIAFEGMSVVEQATTMANCDVVVAPHGGGLTNLIFCAPGTKVIEIYSPELVATYFWKICNRLGLDYYYMLGNGAPETWRADYPQSWDARADIEVNLETLDRTLALAGVSGR